MNAPALPVALRAEQQIELLPIAALAPSDTHIQARRRQRYGAAALAELAQTIAAMGVLEPILVRRLSALRGLAAYEIVAGERRWRAAQAAGLAHVPAIVRAMGDAEVLEAQLVENLQREQLDALEQAEGFRELRALGLSIEDIGAKVGLKRSQVYARLQLLELSPPVQAAVQSGQLDLSKAQLVARFRSAKLQAKALEILTGWRRDWSVKRAAAGLAESLMARLDRAPFALDDAAPITVKLARGQEVTNGACTDCPCNSANDAELAEALCEEGDAAAVPHCLERPCYEAKCERHTRQLRAAAEAAGRAVIAGEAAQKIVGGQHDPLNGYVDLDDSPLDNADFPEPEPEDQDSAAWQAWDERAARWTPPSWRQLLGEAVQPADAVLIEHPRTGRLFEALPAKLARAAAKAKGVKLDRYAVPADYKEPKREKRADPAAEKQRWERERQEAERERQYRLRLLRAVHAKASGTLQRLDLEVIASAMLRSPWDLRSISEALGLGKTASIPALRDADLARLLICNALHELDGGAQGKPGRLLAYCQRYKIDARALREEPGSAKATRGKQKPAKKAKRK